MGSPYAFGDQLAQVAWIAVVLERADLLREVVLALPDALSDHLPALRPDLILP
jgi:hypothetical protein